MFGALKPGDYFIDQWTGLYGRIVFLNSGHLYAMLYSPLMGSFRAFRNPSDAVQKLSEEEVAMLVLSGAELP